MRKKTNIIMCFSAVALLGASLLSSCGKKGATEATGGLEAENFNLYIHKTNSDGDEVRLSSHGQALVSDEESEAEVVAWDAPEGADVSFEVTDSDGNIASDVSVDKDGKLHVSKVSEAKEYTLSVVASKDGKTIKKGVELTVAPDEMIAKNTELDWSGYNTEHLTEIMGVAEEYLLENGMMGAKVFSTGGYRKVSKRLYNTLSEDGSYTSSSYIPSYGFGITDYGKVVTDNPTETDASMKRYYHTETSKLSDDFNYYKASDSVTGDCWSYINATYFTTLVNEAGNSWQYESNLSKYSAPVPIDDNGVEQDIDAEGSFSKWKVYLNDDVKYNYGGKAGTVCANYDGVKAKLIDYVTPFAIQFTQWTGCANVAQLLTGSSSIKGVSEWYAATATKPASGKIDVDAFIKAVGITLNEEENSITFETNGKFTTAFSSYRLNNYGPLPMSLFEEIGGGDVEEGVKKYGTASTTDNTAVQDNVVSTGRWVLTEFDTDKRMVLKKNSDWLKQKDDSGRDIYLIDGMVETLNTALKTDTTNTIAYNQYLAGYTDYSAIPSTMVNDLKNEEDTVKITDGGSSYGFTFNSLDQIDYQYLFGEDGVACGYGTASEGEGSGAKKEEDQVDPLPIMSNHNWIKALNTSFNRQAIADSLNLGGGATSFWSSTQKMTPKASSSYNETDAHKNAVKAVYGEDGISTNSVSEGMRYFRRAIQEEIEAGHLQVGTAENPTEIKIEANHYGQSWSLYYASAYDAMEETFAAAIQQSEWHDENGNPFFTLTVDNTYESSADWENTYMRGNQGEQQIYNGSLTGGDYDVYGFLVYFESRNYYGNLTLWYGSLTEVPNATLLVDGKYYSLDAIAFATEGTVKLGENGEFTNRYTDF